MNWSEICIHTTNEAIEPISNILHETGASGLVIEDPLDLVKERDAFFGELFELDPSEYPEEGVRIKGYLPVNSFLSETIEEIKQAINNLSTYGIELGQNTISLNEVDEEEWSTAWKKYYKPVKISKRITITPTWEDYKPVSSDEVIIELDPGMAFGTGTHPTTVLSIQALENFLSKGDTVIDVGSGSGVLSIAAALLGAESVQAYDLDDVAVTSTKFNVELNKLSDKIQAEQKNLLESVHTEADIIVSNILAEIIVQFIDEAWERLKPGGYFITSGIIQNKKQMVKTDLEVKGFEIIQINEMEEWISIVARKNVS
ncbi:50S ribosomal protein L11 methyltransferase [Virgibacillus halodenitrificans]|uniref:50S ribosomal protein L11 methyltransferase n=1 Tax=Virgibacillus halodenitrificans TaxID=1482 RepID=UPI0024BFB727|nr:50S ribosomal protein L11 methyltransferase [Virgibacillus halodenitrificans]WHX27552.1 50S ribosomal protein L11 methyltransferase [Virgibacillus halodenitrificans]